jgi:hypothetical protein
LILQSPLPPRDDFSGAEDDGLIPVVMACHPGPKT